MPDKNKITLILILIFTISPFFMAKYIYDHQELLDKTKTTSKGHLISQNKIFNISNLDLKNSTVKSTSTMDWVDNKWHLLYFPENNKINNEIINTLQNVNIALGKNESRLQRVIITTSDDNLNVGNIPNSQKFLSLKQISKNNKNNLYLKFNILEYQDTIWIADPLGNVMLYYTQPFDQHKFKDILADLKKLLSISIIG
tara:strand:- start:11162 stop:11758 length:597 start_codon:yes stop_codon:yes gene_type:complete